MRQDAESPLREEEVEESKARKLPVLIARYRMTTPPVIQRPPISPHRFDDWTLSPSKNWVQLTSWLASLKGEHPFNLFGIFWVLLCPLPALYGLFVTPWYLKTVIFALCFYVVSAVSLTGGYHRLFSHRTFQAPAWVRFLILATSSSVFQGTCLVWARNHRAHHRYMDTDKDPYNAKRGFWWSHMGWAIQQHRPEEMSEIDISDLTSDPVLMHFHNYYGPWALGTGVLLPSLICGFGWGDFAGGFWLAGILRIVVFLHCTFLINSLAHYEGDKHYNEHITPVDNVWANLLTMGEGYHNFHHSFPYDYRGSELKLRLDPAKWFVDFLTFFGLANNVKTVPNDHIEHTKIECIRRQLADRSLRVEPGIPHHELPEMSAKDVLRRTQEGASLMVIDGLIVDVAEFFPVHPGGEAILKTYLGKDATAAFNGQLVRHTATARVLTKSMAIAKIKCDDSN